ncbi:MAG: lysophospholipid acyltransferase family protein, partial [Candidatus Hydrogenedentales bacterium]
GIHVRYDGIVPQPGSFIAPNHLGYTDVIALGAVVKCFFVAKRDIEHWPFIGLLFRVTEQIGVPRGRSHCLLDAYQKINERLKDRQSVCVFLEGTSTGGSEVREFHGALLQVAINAAAPVVPTAIRWQSDSDDMDIAEDVAYWKDHAFVPHLWRLLGLRGINVLITFGRPISSAAYDRKALAKTARQEVVKLLDLPAGA